MLDMKLHRMSFSPFPYQCLIAIAFRPSQTEIAMSDSKAILTDSFQEQMGKTHRVHSSAYRQEEWTLHIAYFLNETLEHYFLFAIV